MTKELKLEEYIELDEDEAREFFNKYDKEELEAFDFIFYFAMSYNLTKTREILKEVYNKKTYTSNEDFDIKSKNNILSYRELNYIYNLLDDGWMCTVNTRDLIDYSQEGEELDRMRTSVYKEMENRNKTNINVLTLK